MGRKARKAGDPKVAVGYIRVSTSEQANGPEAQREAMEGWCRREGMELVEVFEDLGVSGAMEIDKRAGLLGALDALGEHGAGILIVAKRDRVARDVLLSAMVERLAQRSGAQVVSADGCGNGTSAEAEMMRGIVACFAAYERALIRARTAQALSVKKRRGERVGSVPLGWKLDGDGVHLVADDDEQEIIRLARELQGEGLTLRGIGAELERRGVLPRSGGKWSPGTVSRVVNGRVAEAA